MTQHQHGDPLLIEITSDFVCPWCFIGEARLERAIKLVAPKIPIKYIWRPYELNPDMPEGGMDRQDYMAGRFGLEKLKTMDARMKELGKEDGIEFRQELIRRSPNTRMAHRLTWLAEKEGKTLAPLILKAYFSEGRDIGNIEVLTGLAEKAGMNAEKIRDFLASDEGVDEIKSMEEDGKARGIEGVPFITIGSEEIHGAETVEEMVAALKRALKGRKAA